MKIWELLSTIRLTIKEITDDSKYTDSYLWSLVVQARATVLGNNIKGKSFISSWSSHRFCIELELVKAELLAAKLLKACPLEVALFLTLA